MSDIPLDLYRAALAERDEWKARYDDLLTKYHALRMEGGSGLLPPAAKTEPDVVSLAMTAMARGSRGLLKQYAEYVNLRRAQGVIEDEIAAEIRRGDSDADAAIDAIPAEQDAPVEAPPLKSAVSDSPGLGSVPVV